MTKDYRPPWVNGDGYGCIHLNSPEHYDLFKHGDNMNNEYVGKNVNFFCTNCSMAAVPCKGVRGIGPPRLKGKRGSKLPVLQTPSSTCKSVEEG